MLGSSHLPDELTRNADRVVVETAHGPLTGARAQNGCAVFLEVPYALPPGRFQDPVPLPSEFRYENKEYLRETAYAAQPLNDGQAAGTPFQDKVGYGEPTENPLFLNIVIPPSFPSKKGFPVKIYIHGGFLQFGSPHSLGSQAQFVVVERSEIWINVGYRLSAFGFLASDKPNLTGNYGFKDQWLSLEWIKKNIEAFGGDSNNIQLTGLSAGAHSVHQILHHAALLPEGTQSPFHSAVLQSNAILVDPKSQSELRPQFEALCAALKLDPSDPDILETLRDPVKVPWKSITSVIENDVLGPYGTFRGCLQEDWITVTPGPMELQRSGELGRRLKARGIRSLVIGDLTQEWYLYSIAHPIHSQEDIYPNVERYFPPHITKALLESFPNLPKNATAEQAIRLYGEVMSCAQVHVPVRRFAQDLQASGIPVLRYEIRWTPEQHRPFGYVTHGCDRLIWAFRTPSLQPDQIQVAKAWLDKISEEVGKVESTGVSRAVTEVLALNEDRSISWTKDRRWDELETVQRRLDKADNFLSSHL